ncbi:MAG: transposase [Proteobacteria bacterium]|nr:transposase [Pseudomonadota bacterium]MBU1739182.1 transposase [Pseudomonadota bacterium]
MQNTLSFCFKTGYYRKHGETTKNNSNRGRWCKTHFHYVLKQDIIENMPRQPRMDAPGTLHHIMGRGIERTKIFRNRIDRDDFLIRLAGLCSDETLLVYAWVLMPNHFHILARTGRQPLSSSMRRLLTGYVVNFNKRHKRAGHLFQNRYKSIVCEDEPYLLELTRYIHLNPLRARLVNDLAGLNKYEWSGHSALMGTAVRDWQEQETILAYFGTNFEKARKGYESFVKDGIAFGSRPELVGGGLLRSHGDWSQVVSFRRKGNIVSADARILGGSDFVDQLLSEVEKKEKETLRLFADKLDLTTLLVRITEDVGVEASAVKSGVRKRAVVRVRKLLCQIAVRRMGYSGAEVARFLGITTSTVNRLASGKELPEIWQNV